MEKAIELSILSVTQWQGGPFGAVIVRDGVILAEGFNQVTKNCDATAHAEIIAIRAACHRLKTHDLSGAEIYTSCEPCPMCLSAIYWSKIKYIYYGNTKEDAAKINFNDEFIYTELNRPALNRNISMTQLMPDEAKNAFELWANKLDKIVY